ncbi:hypothetical protein [Flavobacterium ginsengiterrae]|uniref:hypothetical protein n=1 Tax=Flavobacterium ginsengiterrae TaxID=871695 RepID=UPI0031ED4AFD
MNYTKENFPKICSERHLFLTVLMYGLFGLLLIAMLALLTAVPLSIQLEHNSPLSSNEIIFNVIYFPLIFFGIWKLYKNYQHHKLKKTVLIYIDRNGLHYQQFDGSVRSILYQELEKSTEPYRSDIDIRIGTKYSPGYIFGFKDRARIPIHFSTAENGLSYVPKNKYRLIAHFLQGAALFCPHIKVSPAVYSDYFIDLNTLEFNKKSRTITYVIFFAALIIVLLGIDLLTKYTMGFSLLF